MRLIPTARLKYLLDFYRISGDFPSSSLKDVLSVGNLTGVDKSFYRTVVFEALVATDQAGYIAQYIRAQTDGSSASSTSSSSSGGGSLSLLSLSLASAGQTCYVMEDVGRVHQWAVDYKRLVEINPHKTNYYT
jgi:hypothetical protein